MKNLKFYMLLACLLACKDHLIEPNQDTYQNTSTKFDSPIYIKNLEDYIKAELEDSETVEKNYNGRGKDQNLRNLIASLDSDNFDLFFENLGTYTRDERWILTPLIGILKQFYFFPSLLAALQKDPSDQEVKKDVEEFLSQLQLTRDLYFDFSEEKLSSLISSSIKDLNIEFNASAEKIEKLLKVKSKNRKVISIFNQNKEKGSDFFLFCAKPYEGVFDDYIKIYELLDQGNLEGAKQNIEKFMEKYSITWDQNNPTLLFDADSFFSTMSRMKVNQIESKILEVEPIRKAICEGNMTEPNPKLISTNTLPKGWITGLLGGTQLKSPKERDANWEDYELTRSILSMEDPEKRKAAWIKRSQNLLGREVGTK